MAERSYNWATLLYPESCAADIPSVLQQIKVPCALSPLHDADIREDTGELKKPHYHLVLHYSSLKSQMQVKGDVLQLGGVGAERVRDLYSYVRYLIHIDNPEKAQYDINSIQAFNGFKVDKYFEAKKIDTDEGFVALISIILQHGYTDYSQIVTYCLKNDAELLPSCRKSAYALSSFLRARAYQLNEDKRNRNQT